MKETILACKGETVYLDSALSQRNGLSKVRRRCISQGRRGIVNLNITNRKKKLTPVGNRNVSSRPATPAGTDITYRGIVAEP